jgi:hypothetical protein
MKFRLTQSWPLDGGAWTAPAGTVFDYDGTPDHWTTRAPRGSIPVNATPLDQESWDAQQAAFPEHRHLLGPKTF